MPYLTPDDLPEESACRSLLIPDSPDWLAIVSGAINELAQEWNWEQQGAVTTEEAAQAMLQMWLSFVDSVCGSGGTTRRYNPVTGEIEISEDGGETWEPDPEFPPTPSRPSGEPDKICMAAKNAANVLKILYEDTIDAYNINTAFDEVLSAFAASIGLAISSLFGAPVAAILAVGGTIFTLVYQTLDVLFTDYWTDETTSALECILIDVATLDGDVVTFDGEQLFYNIRTQFFLGVPFDIPQALVWEQIIYLLSIIGQQGLNHAGATTAITEGVCDCNDEWCYEFDFKTGAHSWVTWARVVGAGAVLVAGQGWRAPVVPEGSTYPSRSIHIKIDLPEDINVTQVTIWREPNNIGVSNVNYFNGLTLIGGSTSVTEGSAIRYNFPGTSFVSNMIGALIDTNTGVPGEFGDVRLTKIRLRGTGANPFAEEDNCV